MRNSRMQFFPILLNVGYGGQSGSGPDCYMSNLGSQTVCQKIGGLRNPNAQEAADAYRALNKSSQAFVAQSGALAAERDRRRSEEQTAMENARANDAEKQRALIACRLVTGGPCDMPKAWLLNEGDFASANQVAQACARQKVLRFRQVELSAR